ncbi:putative NAD(P)/FAD-binding protein YdhS [Rhizobium skierniewicense]|uniref:Putative NAD(P)/FAD-binding protein YdhS n=1 Tax=Rhizobium skierniewicense TaxID=984260 RepID=A0A7W6G3S0_9HYPH|nr:FAD/NAD(P)-binding protein [Rhizobium skierniewicense]MBB3948142.1 putative NAD(P)/FAD-binding protein YdhS [Rhizobium skierniewicense]
MFYDVAVVGSGFSAISLVTNLLEQLPATTSIAIVGDDSAFGRGTAYRTELHLHRLNVPAARMSVFADRPNDFQEWLEKRGEVVDGMSFAPRNDYGLYLRDRLASLLQSQQQRARVDFVKAKAVSCASCTKDGVDFRLNDGRQLHASNVALCLGVGTASLPRLTADSDVALLRRVVRNPWKLGWLSRVKKNDAVVILGSGLTMIDQVLSLRNKGHRGPIHFLSRRGLVPHCHSKTPLKPVDPDITGATEMSEILARLRQQVRGGADWRSVMDGLRPKTQSLWQQLEAPQRARFLRHALAWWNIHRHRIAPQVHDVFDELVKNGTVQVHAGFVSKIARTDGDNVLTYRGRGVSDEISLTFDWLVNCTGMERAGIGHSPLLQDMLGRHMIETDTLGLGIRVDSQSRIVSGDGLASPGMFAVGALTAGQFWEITAVPDIRVQTHNVAESIAKRIDMTSL